jgi:hypothetical protein
LTKPPVISQLPGAPLGSHDPAKLHSSAEPVQSTVDAAAHTPAEQVALVVHGFASMHAPNSLMGPESVSQFPSMPSGSQLSAALQASAVAEQFTGAPPPHVPAVQIESVLQASPSSHRVPSVKGCAISQLPAKPAGSQVESALQTSPVPEQSGAVPPAQRPVWHVEPTRQTSPSSQASPSLVGVKTSQLPSVPAGSQVLAALH